MGIGTSRAIVSAYITGDSIQRPSDQNLGVARKKKRKKKHGSFKGLVVFKYFYTRFLILASKGSQYPGGVGYLPGLATHRRNPFDIKGDTPDSISSHLFSIKIKHEYHAIIGPNSGPAK